MKTLLYKVSFIVAGLCMALQSLQALTPESMYTKLRDGDATGEDLQAYVEERIQYRWDSYVNQLTRMQDDGVDQKVIDAEIPLCVRQGEVSCYDLACYLVSTDCASMPDFCQDALDDAVGLSALGNRIEPHAELSLFLVLNDTAEKDPLLLLHTIEHEITHLFQFFNAAALVDNLVTGDATYEACFKIFSKRRSIRVNGLTNDQAQTLLDFVAYVRANAEVTKAEQTVFLKQNGIVNAKQCDFATEKEADTQAVHFHPHPKKYLKKLQKDLFNVALATCGAKIDIPHDSGHLGYLSFAGKEQILLKEHGNTFDSLVAQHRKALGWLYASWESPAVSTKINKLKLLPKLKTLYTRLQAKIA